MKILVTGAAGFIGHHVAQRLCAQGHSVVGIDTCNDYYDPALKRARLAAMTDVVGFRFERLDCADRDGMAALFADGRFDRVCHLAAQAGVRYSLQNPYAYIDANLDGFITILEGCRHHGIDHLVYASSSSVYGNNRKIPFAESDPVEGPVSLYAATKRANELMAYTYSHLYGIAAIGLRFFTVYGPFGRPDMAYWHFTEQILRGEPIRVFNNGNCKRDFTYIDDIVTGVVATLVDEPATPLGADGSPRARIYNIGNDQPVQLLDFIACIEQALGATATRELVPAQPGDVEATWADVTALRRDYDFSPDTPLATGIERFVTWYRDYYAT
ncbi:MAG: NAD-dependent epimerase/dehydratase family protein [Planctomycetota bacterium]